MDSVSAGRELGCTVQDHVDTAGWVANLATLGPGSLSAASVEKTALQKERGVERDRELRERVSYRAYSSNTRYSHSRIAVGFRTQPPASGADPWLSSAPAAAACTVHTEPAGARGSSRGMIPLPLAGVTRIEG